MAQDLTGWLPLHRWHSCKYAQEARTSAIIEVFARVTSGVSWAGEVTLPSGVRCLLVIAASGSI